MGRCSMELRVFPFEREEVFERVFFLVSREAVNEGRGEEIAKRIMQRGEGYRFVYPFFLTTSD